MDRGSGTMKETIDYPHTQSRDRVVAFLTRIGMPVHEGYVPYESFSRHVAPVGGTLVYESYAHPGDMLHEAGHLAIIPSIFRSKIHGDVDDTLEPLSEAYFKDHPDAFARNREDPIARHLMQCGDPEAIAWSYAAALAAGVDTFLPFENGFVTQDPRMIHDSVKVGCYAGINGLRAAGFLKHVSDFPRLERWLAL